MDYQGWLDSFESIEDNKAAAVAAADDLGRLSQRARTLLLPILSEAFVIHRGNIRRAVEHKTPIMTVFSGETTVEARRERLENTFPLPDGTRVDWSSATVEQHELRIAYLESHIAGVRRTIEEHEKAIAMIEEYGVTCLGEIG